jgi:hypothetical protein
MAGNSPAGFDELDNGSAKPRKRNAKALQGKSKTHSVFPQGDNVYTVVSGSSGNGYRVVMFDDLTGNCNCNWGTLRPEALRENKGAVGCSHVLAVIGFIATGKGKRVSTWADVEQARRQHKPIVSAGDGLVVTVRKNGSRHRVQSTFFALVDSQNAKK